MEIKDYPITLRVEDVAEIIRISRDSAYELSKRADFPCVMAGRRILIPREAFATWYLGSKNNGGNDQSL